MVASWDEIKEKIKDAYNEIESEYEKLVESAIDKVKGRSHSNTAIKMALSAIPIMSKSERHV